MNKIEMSKENQNDCSIRVEVNQSIKAPAKEIFSLACPVMEYKWIPGWKCELIHFPNGHMEQGCIFNEILSAPLLADSIAQKTTWTAVLYEPDKHRVHFRLDNKISSSLYKIEFEADASGETKSRLELTYTPLNNMRIGTLKKGGEAKLRLMISALSLMLKYYCEHGEMVKTSEIIKLSMQVKERTSKDRIRSLLNKLVMMVMQDESRKKFQKGLPIRKVKYI
jgi:Polyketide cyclase / dehydrase and lipid transport